MKIKIYQITEEKDARDLMFMRKEWVDHAGGVDPSEYELVFEGTVRAFDLDDVYAIFNDYARMPAGYRGRSLSVSDVVVTEECASFCDSYGWVDLDESVWPVEEV